MNMLCEVSSEGVFGVFKSFFAVAKDSFLNFSFVDAADILLLSLILFVAFRFLKGRKAGALLFGVALVVLITAAAYAIGLNTVYAVFSSILKIGVLALIIIFQPEIRDALEKIGSGSMNGIKTFGDQRKKNQLYLGMIDQVCNAVMDLSVKKTGALIVIARTTKLDEISETGITINADVNSFLIRNLFFNNAPLHDGAVVIDEAKIVAAGCLLPLTRRTDVDGDLGTRHRAAIGMSETSDAIVIVVSEETGTVSVAFDCTLVRDFTAESLRSFLMKKLIRHGQSDSDK